MNGQLAFVGPRDWPEDQPNTLFGKPIPGIMDRKLAYIREWAGPRSLKIKIWTVKHSRILLQVDLLH